MKRPIYGDQIYRFFVRDQQVANEQEFSSQLMYLNIYIKRCFREKYVLGVNM